MEPNMALDHLCHQRVHSAPAGRDVMKDLGALPFLIQGLLDCGHLAQDAMDAV